jgi:hypothetical protein
MAELAVQTTPGPDTRAPDLLVTGFDCRQGKSLFFSLSAYSDLLRGPLSSLLCSGLLVLLPAAWALYSHSRPFSAEVKNAWSYACTPHLRLFILARK